MRRVLPGSQNPCESGLYTDFMRQVVPRWSAIPCTGVALAQRAREAGTDVTMIDLPERGSAATAAC